MKLILVPHCVQLVTHVYNSQKKSFGRDTLNLEFEGDGGFLQEMERAGRLQIVDQGPNRYVVRLAEATQPREILDVVLGSARSLYCYELVEPSLKEIFVRTVG